jgi:hypothetical protein
LENPSDRLPSPDARLLDKLVQTHSQSTAL